MKKLKMMAAVMAVTATVALLGAPIQARAAEEDFDPVFSAETYPDVVAVIGTDAEALYNHYINNGKAEGRLPHATTADAPTTQTKAGSKWEEIEPYLENAPTVDMNDPGSERLREMLKDVPVDDELREIVIRIGDGAKWDFDSKYEYRDNGRTHNSADACRGYTDMITSIVYGHDTFAYGDKYLTANVKNPLKLHQYDTVVVPGYKGALHVALILYIDPVTGDMLTTEGNWNGVTRTGWNLYCYSAFYLVPKTGVFRRINWSVKHSRLICRLTILHSLQTWKSRPLASLGKP